MLGAMYRAMTRTLVDAEKLLDSELLNGSTDINDKPGAPDLVVSDGDRIRYVLFLLPFSVINLVRYQTTSALRTMVVNLPCVVSLSASLREDL
jgi:ABC-type transport system involved in Fe-S cluster assembly fused permease/ATPase subunit